MGVNFFGVSEFACHDGTPYPEIWVDTRLGKLRGLLNKYRARWGNRVRVVCGYRTEAWNIRVGGAKKSQHPQGRAADIAPILDLGDTESQSLFAAELESFHAMILEMLTAGLTPELGGIGFYPGKWVHVDVRDRPLSGHVATWIGTGIGSEQA